jgi:hypothetical protein
MIQYKTPRQGGAGTWLLRYLLCVCVCVRTWVWIPETCIEIPIWWHTFINPEIQGQKQVEFIGQSSWVNKPLVQLKKTGCQNIRMWVIEEEGSWHWSLAFICLYISIAHMLTERMRHRLLEMQQPAASSHPWSYGERSVQQDGHTARGHVSVAERDEMYWHLIAAAGIRVLKFPEVNRWVRNEKSKNRNLGLWISGEWRRRPRAGVEVGSENEEAVHSKWYSTIIQKITMVVNVRCSRRPWK